MTVQVLFFGPARDLTGTEATTLDVADGMTVADVRAELAGRYPPLADVGRVYRIAVNQTFTPDNTVVRDGDEIAVIPPVSGGMADPLIELVRDAIAADRVRGHVLGDPALGGVATFEGVTRRDEDAEHGALLRLEYEAFEPMAEKQLSRLATAARTERGAQRIAIVHRLGPVEPGEVSVMIAVACPHRAEAFDACRWLIDAIKRDVPIWKRDVFADGFTRWVDPRKGQ